MHHISDMSRRLTTVYVWGLLVFSFLESLILLCTFLVFSWSLNCASLICKLSQFGPSYFFGSLDTRSYLVVAFFDRWILIHQFFRYFFWPVNCTWIAFDLRIFSIGIHEKCKSNHDLLLLAFSMIWNWYNSGL